MAKGSTDNQDRDETYVSKGSKKKPARENVNASKVNEKGAKKNPGKSGNGAHVVNSANPFANVLKKAKGK